ncbi:hypothetical protein RUM43_014522 [Polyplax serrata]|uniref:Uncharacterized protein n=1 Tax=Polyplax serrata TaxID=468196 RepID=A0AAN8S5Y3_POLSC
MSTKRHIVLPAWTAKVPMILDIVNVPGNNQPATLIESHNCEFNLRLLLRLIIYYAAVSLVSGIFVSDIRGIEAEDLPTTKVNCPNVRDGHIADTSKDTNRTVLKIIDIDGRAEVSVEDSFILHQAGSKYDLIDSQAQWLAVQKRQAEGVTGVQQATVVNNMSRTSGYLNSGMETESEKSYRYKRKQQKKHRSRSRSPSDFSKGRLPDEVKKHLEFRLIDTEGMSETQLRDIPYKVVETNTSGRVHRKQSPSGRRKHHSKRCIK